MGQECVRGVALYKRSAWRRSLDEAKVEMDLARPFSQAQLDYSLHAAVIENNHRAIREMVEMGADPDMWIEAQAGEPAGTLLHFAVRHGTLKSVIALLQLGADPSARDALDATPRMAAQSRLSGQRMKTVLKLWEQRRARVHHNDNAVISFDKLLQDVAS